MTVLLSLCLTVCFVFCLFICCFYVCRSTSISAALSLYLTSMAITTVLCRDAVVLCCVVLCCCAALCRAVLLCCAVVLCCAVLSCCAVWHLVESSLHHIVGCQKLSFEVHECLGLPTQCVLIRPFQLLDLLVPLSELLFERLNLLLCCRGDTCLAHHLHTAGVSGVV